MNANDDSNPTTPSAPFLQGLAERQLRYQRCVACGQAQSLARYACMHCGSDRLRWDVAAGTARLHAVTVVARAPSDAFRALAPYTLVIAELDEGPRLMAHGAAGAQIGDRVTAAFFDHDGRMLVRFDPVGN